ncbi:substrate-binding domain-containing protein [bacterium]
MSVIVPLWSGNTGKIAGTVTDKETGEPLPGANVVIEGTSLGAAADIEGQFSILHVPPQEYMRFQSLLLVMPKPVGILACNDDWRQHILEVCKRIGFKMPEDVAVIGMDSDPSVCEIGDPPLTRIALNAETAGCEATKPRHVLYQINHIFVC